jgi:hypothetical protein
VEFPSIDGDEILRTCEMLATGPEPPAPAQAVQLVQALISSMLEKVLVEPLEPVSPELELPTVTLMAFWKMPEESFAWTVILCAPALAEMYLSMEELETPATLLPSRYTLTYWIDEVELALALTWMEEDTVEPDVGEEIVTEPANAVPHARIRTRVASDSC